MKKFLAAFGVLMLIGAGCSDASSSEDLSDVFNLPPDVKEVYYDFQKFQIAVDDDNCYTFTYYFADYSDITEADCPHAFTAFNAGLAADIDWSATEVEGDNAFIYTKGGDLLTMLVLEDGRWLGFEDFWTIWEGL